IPIVVAADNDHDDAAMTSIPIAIVPIVPRRRRRRGRDRRILRIVTGVLVLMLVGILVSALARVTIRSAFPLRALRAWVGFTRLDIPISAVAMRALLRARRARGCGWMCQSRISRLLRRHGETDATAAFIGDERFAQQE